ncbi:hypothetical protein pb186bvf_018357 [Paramecium bursaria]
MQFLPIEDQISEIILNVAKCWDARQFDEARKYFAFMVEIDYRSMGAHKTEYLQIDELVNSWKSILPGFDSTQHKIEKFQIKCDDEIFIVESQAHIKHVIGDEDWTVLGNYIHKLTFVENELKIIGITLLAFQQIGSPGLQDVAKARLQ